MNTPITEKRQKITLSDLQDMERMLDKIYDKSGSFSEQTQNTIFKARHLIRLESSDLALVGILEIIKNNNHKQERRTP